MREIKFRAWDASRNEWSEQSFAIDQHGDLHMWRQIYDDRPNYAYGRNDLHPIIEMYTGLQDYAGKEIWEGDIVPYKLKLLDQKTLKQKWFTFNGVVTWDDIKSGWYLKTIDNAIHDISKHSASDSRVIGNVHENPELLDGPQKKG